MTSTAFTPLQQQCRNNRPAWTQEEQSGRLSLEQIASLQLLHCGGAAAHFCRMYMSSTREYESCQGLLRCGLKLFQQIFSFLFRFVSFFFPFLEKKITVRFCSTLFEFNGRFFSLISVRLQVFVCISTSQCPSVTAELAWKKKRFLTEKRKMELCWKSFCLAVAGKGCSGTDLKSTG